MQVIVLAEPGEHEADAKEHKIHLTNTCRSIAARAGNGFDPGDYTMWRLDQVKDDVLACQFPECFQGMADAGAVKNSLLASVFRSLSGA